MNRYELLAHLQANYSEDIAIELLEEEVQDAKASEAAAINNDGLESQLWYLLNGGYQSQEGILELLGDVE